jgi:prevent-host-death family protein
MVNLHDAKSSLSKLVDRAANGEEIVLARAGKPIAKLVALTEADRRRPRRVGVRSGDRFWMSPDFDEWPPDLAERLGG